MAKAGNKNGLKHGLSRTRIYNEYYGMYRRCNYPTTNSYNDYGGRGITICNEWLGKDGFINFYNWSMKNGYNDTLTLDRINVDSNYEPSNCRWITIKKQCNNRRSNRLLEFNGKVHTMAEWCELYNIQKETLYYRLKKGMSVEESLLKPVKKHTHIKH